MDDLVERKLEMLFRDLKPYADKPTGSLRIGMDEVHAILSLQARIQALETSLAEAEGRVIAEVVAWLRGQAEEVDASRLHWNNREIIASTVANVATALETGEWRNAQSV